MKRGIFTRYIWHTHIGSPQRGPNEVLTRLIFVFERVYVNVIDLDIFTDPIFDWAGKFGTERKYLILLEIVFFGHLL